MDILLLLGLIGFMILYCKKKNREEYEKKVTDNKQFSKECSQYANKKILDLYGEEKFIVYYGKDQLDKIKSGTDADIVRLIKR